jgi:hypothetical protein
MTATFSVLLCVAILATAFVTSGVFDFHKSDAAGQGLAKAFTVFATIALIALLGILMWIAGTRASLSGAWVVIVIVVYLAAAAAEFGAVYVLTDLHNGDRYEALLRLLVPAIPIFAILFAALHFYMSAPATAARLAIATAALIVSAISLATIGPAKSASRAAFQKLAAAYQATREKDQALAAEARALPAITPVVEFLRYAELGSEHDDARTAAVSRMKAHPDRQSQVESILDNLDVRILPMLADLELEVTPQLCQAARKCLRKSNERFVPTEAAPTYSSIEDRLFWFGIDARWLLEKGCDCKAEIADLEKNVRLYPDPYPKKFFIDHLLELQGKPRE